MGVVSVQARVLTSTPFTVLASWCLLALHPAVSEQLDQYHTGGGLISGNTTGFDVNSSCNSASSQQMYDNHSCLRFQAPRLTFGSVGTALYCKVAAKFRVDVPKTVTARCWACFTTVVLPNRLA